MAEPKAPASTSRAGDAARILGGIVVVAVVVGIGLWAERATDDDLELPDEVAGLVLDDSTEAADFADASDERLSEAYDDADAATAIYADDDLRVLVTAVRADSGPPVPPVFGEDQEWVEDDDVTCLVSDAPDDASTLCQRDGGDLTVRVYVEGDADVDTLVDLTNDVWEDVS